VLFYHNDSLCSCNSTPFHILNFVAMLTRERGEYLKNVILNNLNHIRFVLLVSINGC